ncbi:myeloid-associated differentiation marker-like [Aplochiton taeniatus]
MPGIVLEAQDFTSSLSLVRTWALLFGCLTFSLVASLSASDLSTQAQLTPTFRISCMITWCFFFILTLLIHILNVIQFHSLIPISWKNLTVTVAALGTLMCLGAAVVFPWMVMTHQHTLPHPVAASVASCLTFLAYASETYLIRAQSQEQRGYMASVPGLLKVLQVWGGCQMIPLVVEGVRGAWKVEEGVAETWKLLVSGVAYALCLLMSLGSVVVILGDCAGRCPLPFDRLLPVFGLTGLLLCVVATVICFTKVLWLWNSRHNMMLKLVVMETVIACITLIAYTVDLAFSIKLLRCRSHA